MAQSHLLGEQKFGVWRAGGYFFKKNKQKTPKQLKPKSTSFLTQFKH